MSFRSTSIKHRKYQSLMQLVLFVLIIYDLRNEQVLKSAFGEINSILIFLWVWGLFGLLGMVAMMAMLGPFYKAGGKVWTEGGREQFAFAGGFTASFYGTLLMEAATIVLYPTLLDQFPFLPTKGGLVITLISIIASAVFCGISALVLFGRYKYDATREQNDGYH